MDHKVRMPSRREKVERVREIGMRAPREFERVQGESAALFGWRW